DLHIINESDLVRNRAIANDHMNPRRHPVRCKMRLLDKNIPCERCGERGIAGPLNLQRLPLICGPGRGRRHISTLRLVSHRPRAREDNGTKMLASTGTQLQRRMSRGRRCQLEGCAGPTRGCGCEIPIHLRASRVTVVNQLDTIRCGGWLRYL